MPDCMIFPDNIMDFIDDYSFEDSDHVYTNGSKLIPSFRVKQAIEHYFQEQKSMEPKVLRAPLGKDYYFCRACDARIVLDDGFCWKCGKAVKWK